jgi:CHAD domain-containing protein
METIKSDEHFTDYFISLQLVFAFHFENATLQPEEGVQATLVEDLHKLRVEIKKQRAFFRFLEELPRGIFNRTEHFRILASIFKPGGRLRETHVNQALVKLYRSYSLEGYKQFLVGKNTKQTKKFTKALRQFDLAEFKTLNNEVVSILETIDIDTVRSQSLVFIKSELDSIKLLRPKITSDEDLHQIRTHTKALGYITKFLSELSPQQQLIDLLAIAKPTEKLIGNWHDRVVLRLSLETYIRNNPEASDVIEAKKLINQINKRNHASVAAIANRLDGFLSLDFRP